MIDYDRKAWWRVAFSFRGTILPHVLGRVGLLTGLSLGVVFFNHYLLAALGHPLPSIDQLGHSVLGVALSLLIVFRTNTAYARFWEARTLWGGVVNASRNLVRLGASLAGPADELARQVTAFALVLKETLRDTRDFLGTRGLLPANIYDRLPKAANAPGIVARAMNDWVQERLAAGRLEPILAAQLQGYIGQLVDCQGGCEKIKKTPVPFAYASLIKLIVLIYLVTLPFVLIERMEFLTPLVEAVVAFGLLGIEDAGVEIEDPFGRDLNNLPLEAICETIARDAAEASAIS